MLIRPFLPEDVNAVKKFTDQQIGEGYFLASELLENQKKSVASHAEITSFLLVEPSANEVKGLCLAFPAEAWSHSKGSKLRPDLWPFPLEKAGYLQSLFLSKDVQKAGWGSQLSQKSFEIFLKLGCKGVVAHCWKESPHNSSFRYLQKAGFKTVIEHPLYWVDVNYTCIRDGKPCRCTAIEMYLKL